MRILLFTQYCWPENADYKNHVLAKELVQRGHDVTILTTYPNHPRGRIFDGYSQKWRLVEMKDGYKIIRVPIFPTNSHKWYARIMNYASFSCSSLVFGFPGIKPPDIIIVHATPITLGIVVWIPSILWRSKVILDVLDLWPQAFSSGTTKIPALFARITKWIAKVAYQRADRIQVPTTGFKDAISAMGIKPGKISLMPIWAEEKSPCSIPYPIDNSNEKISSNEIRIYYVGNLGPMQNLGSVIEAWGEVNKIYPQVALHCIGDGAERAHLKSMAEKHNANVHFWGSKPKSELTGILSNAEALLLSLRDDSYLNMNFPSKLSNYLSFCRPILVYAKGESARIVKEAGAGLVTDSVSIKGMIELLLEFLSLTKAQKNQMGENGYHCFVGNFEKHLIVQRYICDIERMTNNV